MHAQMERMKSEAVVDVFQFIKSVRFQRAGLVANKVRVYLQLFLFHISHIKKQTNIVKVRCIIPTNDTILSFIYIPSFCNMFDLT